MSRWRIMGERPRSYGQSYERRFDSQLLTFVWSSNLTGLHGTRITGPGPQTGFGSLSTFNGDKQPTVDIHLKSQF